MLRFPTFQQQHLYWDSTKSSWYAQLLIFFRNLILMVFIVLMVRTFSASRSGNSLGVQLLSCQIGSSIHERWLGLARQQFQRKFLSCLIFNQVTRSFHNWSRFWKWYLSDTIKTKNNIDCFFFNLVMRMFKSEQLRAETCHSSCSFSSNWKLIYLITTLLWSSFCKFSCCLVHGCLVCTIVTQFVFSIQS